MLKGGGKKAAVVAVAIIAVTSVVTAPVTAAPTVKQDSVESTTEQYSNLFVEKLVNIGSLSIEEEDQSNNETSTPTSEESKRERPKTTDTPTDGDDISIQCISIEPGDNCDADDDGILNGDDPCPQDPDNDCEEPTDTPTDSPDNPNDISIEDVSGPDGSTTNEESTLETTLSSTEGVESVKFVVEKEASDNGKTVEDTKVNSNPSSTSIQTTVKNDIFGTAASSITVEYRVVVKFDTGSGTNTIKSDWNSYTFSDSGEDVLYVPVTFEGGPNTEPDIRPILTDRADKTRTYFQDQSMGKSISRVNGL